MKKVLITIIALTCAAWWYARTHTGSKEKTIVVGVIQIIDHPALERTYQGLSDALQTMFKGHAIRILRESAQGNPALALQIAQKFVGQEVNMVVAMGTTAAQAARQASNGRVPVVFTSITDPVYAKLVRSAEDHEPWISGISNLVPVEASLKVFQEKWPEVKRIGMIYNPGEPNSVAIVESTRRVCEQAGVALTTLSATKAHEVVSAAQRLMQQVDALWVNNDNTVLATFDALVPLAQTTSCLLWASDVDLKGYTAAHGADQYALGEQTARMVYQHLSGKQPLSATVVEGPDKIVFRKY